MPTPPRFQVTVRRGPRQLRVRQLFTSVDAARAYVREQWRTRRLGFWYESPELVERTGTLMLFAGRESFSIQPFLEWRGRDIPSTAGPSRSPLPAFDDWLRHVLDRPVAEHRGDAWYWHAEAEPWEHSPEPGTVVGYLSRLFEGAATLLRPFSDAQAAQGLEYLINNALSNYMFPLMDPDVAWSERRRAIGAMYVVFASVFEPRCSPTLSHTLTEPDPAVNPLNGPCYMWWDVCPLQGNAGPAPEEDFVLPTEELLDPGPRIDPYAADLEDEILGLLERTLALDNVACQEAGLHGLGHRHHKHAASVEAIVDVYLQSRFPAWPPDEQGQSLRGYALAARRGMVQ